jgi:hypothetical protein
MKNSADYIAQSMKTLLDSPEYKKIFRVASSLEEKEDESCADDKDEDMSKDESHADDKDKKDEDMSYADDKDEDDCGMADDKLEDVTANYDIAIDSLLTASAALDELNSPTGSAATIKLASIIVEAKKKKVEDLKEKAKKDKKDKDKNQAKGKLPPGLKKHLEEKKNKSKKDDKKDLKKGKK